MDMEMFEKVEKLRERANVTFEEALEALNTSNGDLLDAMVYLERQGKVKQPEQSTYTTNYEEQKKFTNVEDTVNAQESDEGIFDSIRGLVKGFIGKCRGNYFCAKKDGEVKIKMPVLAFIVLMLAFWQVVAPAMIIMLFFGFQYSLYGKDELKEANEILSKASDLAGKIRGEFTKEEKKDDNKTE